MYVICVCQYIILINNEISAVQSNQPLDMLYICYLLRNVKIYTYIISKYLTLLFICFQPFSLSQIATKGTFRCFPEYLAFEHIPYK